MSVDIQVGFDGSCPHFAKGVKKMGRNRFVLFPGVRRSKGESEEKVGAGSRLYVRAVNSGSRPAAVQVVADWETPQRTEHHDLGYTRHETQNEWTMIPGWRDGARVEYRLSLPPGVTELALYPEYNVAAVTAFVDALKAQGVSVDILGRSREKRPLYLISLPSPNPKARNFFLQVRDHAYETAGSFCVEGIVEFLRSGEELAAFLRSKFNVFICPMTNPDGVYNGLSRLTWERGADMNRLITKPDAAHDALKAAHERIRPFAFMNIHNWTHKFMDGLLANEEQIATLVRQHMPDDHAHFKRWMVETSLEFLRKQRASFCPDEWKSWKNYCRDQFGAAGCTFEFPWFALNTADMRRKGRQAFIAFALAVIEDTKL